MPSYQDNFRNESVKVGASRIVTLTCPKCSCNQIQEIQIIRTALAFANDRPAGNDYCCPTCHYKWKIWHEQKRPGIYVRTSKSNKEFTKEIARQILSYLDQRFQDWHAQWKARMDKQTSYIDVSLDEVQQIAKYVEDFVLSASEQGDIEEGLVDTFWRMYQSVHDDLVKRRLTASESDFLTSDLETRMGVCKNGTFRWMWEQY